MTDAPPTSQPNRRILLTGLGVLAVGVWVWGVPRLPGLFAADLSFSPIPGAPGFRALDTAVGLTAANAVFAGLETTDPEVDAALIRVRTDPCAALYGEAPAPVPIALFSDFNCPNCPEMDANLAAILAETPDAALTRHELPLLGRTSVVAARSVLAADLQGRYAEMHSALSRTPAVTDLAFVRRLAARAGLDADRLEQDMSDPQITGALAASKALARYLGLIGTPATVIGRTVILGTLPQADIAAIIALERQTGAACN